jgi:GT2 family glycosyltransferase
MNSLPLVSIVILSWNRKEKLKYVLTKLREQSYPNIEIIVVDNGSTDGTVEEVERKFTEVKLIKLPRNIGLEGYNIGFKNAKGKYIVVLDDDSYPEKDAIERGIIEFEKDAALGIIAFHILTPSGEVITKDWPENVTSFWGCGAMIRKSALEKVGYYDPDLFIYGNEYDLAIRMWHYGYKVIYNKNIIGYHMLAKSEVRKTKKGMFYGTRGDIWFCFKYFSGKHLFLSLSRVLFRNFTRAINEKSLFSFFKGIIAGFLELGKIKNKKIKINKKIANFYFENIFFEPIFKRIIRLLLKKSFEEFYFKNRKWI